MNKNRRTTLLNLTSGLALGHLPLHSMGGMRAYGPATKRPETTACDKRKVVNVCEHGAIANGSTDVHPTMQRIMDALAAEGGGTLCIPGHEGTGEYFLSQPLVCRSNVNIVGIGPKPKLLSARDEKSPFAGAILLPGNFHPDFTSKARAIPIKSSVISDGKVLILDVDEHTGHLIDQIEPGDQVLLVGGPALEMGGYMIRQESTCNWVERIEASRLTLGRPVTPTLFDGLIVLKMHKSRQNLDLFFLRDAIFDNLELRSNGAWISDSATQNCQFWNLMVHARNGIYGNSFQDTLWSSCEFHFFGDAVELSHNSQNCLIQDCVFVYQPGDRPKRRYASGISIQEFSKKVTFLDCHLSFDEIPQGGPLVRVLNAKDIRFNRLSVAGSNLGNGSAIYLGHRGTSDFNTHRVEFYDCSFSIGRLARFVYIDNISERSNFGPIEFRKCRFSGITSASDPIRIAGRQRDTNFIESDFAFVQPDN